MFYWPIECHVERYQQELTLQNLMVTTFVSTKTR